MNNNAEKVYMFEVVVVVELCDSYGGKLSTPLTKRFMENQVINVHPSFHFSSYLFLIIFIIGVFILLL